MALEERVRSITLRKTNSAGFTLAGLFCTVTMLTLLAALWLPRRRFSGQSEALKCMTNLRELAVAVNLYATDNNEIFPAHREKLGFGGDWWGSKILNYTDNDTNLFHCPVLKGARNDFGVSWQWAFDMHRVGYGYNAWFLGAAPYPSAQLTVGGIQFLSNASFKRSAVVHPNENLLLGDKVPYGNPPAWSSMLWWPNASMNGPIREGVTPRHGVRGVAAFSDAHVELRTDATINPPVDPGNGDRAALKNARFWDPLQSSPN